MDDDRCHQVASVVLATILSGPHGTFRHWSDNFEVRRVEGQSQVHLSTRRHHVRGKTLVIFNVTRTTLALHSTIKFVKQFAGVLAENINQHVESASVSHGNNRLTNTVSA